MASGSQDEIMFDDEMEDSEDETLSDSEPELNFDVAVPEEDVDDYERLMAERRAIGHGATLNPEYRNLAILMNSKRNVQTGMVGLSSSYIDNDNTGDYDPDSEPSKARKKKKKPKAGIRKKNAKGSAVKLAVERELIVKLFLIPGPQQIKILEEDAAREKVARKDARLKILAERNKMTVRDINGGGRRKTSNPEFIGCGLHLCKICEWTFRRLERSKREEWGLDVLGQLVETRRAELWRWRGDELRADCTLSTDNLT
ncbi:hypothetical protein M7I_6003 [Glarea lozoyensis 74030]|uniref:Uncharacterized protein n=1 Tax=Glarea lozoyensis (strain ATCC 74030 / MF5533) TaxID=1104152 RepID=H0ETE1_GLAL7|nr:hypothetical protein M7I_6003 [Glarea lozoyensis 74030]